MIDTLSDVWVDVIIDVVSDIGAGVLTERNVNVLVAAMTALKFAMTPQLEEFLSFC